jgi:hypothetical protein
MTQKTNTRVLIDTNKHGIRRETNLDTNYKKKLKRNKYKNKHKDRQI